MKTPKDIRDDLLRQFNCWNWYIKPLVAQVLAYAAVIMCVWWALS